MKNWNSETGQYTYPKSSDPNIDFYWPEDVPEPWLSRPDGTHFLGMSFHFAPNNYPEGEGRFEDRFFYTVAPFRINSVQDPYNSWQVNARINNKIGWPEDHWSWLPGILIVDLAKKYTLPNPILENYAGCEAADNDFRLSCGLYDMQVYDDLVRNSVRIVNRLTGPGWAGWPFGQRQLAHSAIAWVRPETMYPDVLALAAGPQQANKYISWGDRLYRREDRLGVWEVPPQEAWDYRQCLKFFYQAQLMLDDGFSEMALSAAIASLENATAEILLFLVDGDKEKAEAELRNIRFLDRFDKLLPEYGVRLPLEKF